jgi:23S rRNA (pseudouridine1915-N3)-methyltransferase
MKIVIFTPKSTYPTYIKDALTEYSKRLSRYCQLSHIEYTMLDELTTMIKDSSFIITISTHCSTITSEQLANTIDHIGIVGYSSIALCLIASNPEALSSVVVNSLSSDASIITHFSLSKMSLSPESSLLLLYEQLYRSYRIIHGEPYHK